MINKSLIITTAAHQYDMYKIQQIYFIFFYKEDFVEKTKKPH